MSKKKGRRQFFKSLRPSKVKTKTSLAKTKTSKNGLKDYITQTSTGN